MSKKENNTPENGNKPENQPEGKKPFMESAMKRKVVGLNAAVGFGAAAFVSKKLGLKAGLVTGVLTTAWTVASAAYWESIEREQAEQQKPDQDKPEMKKDGKNNKGPKL